MSPQLLISAIGHIVSICILLGLGGFVLWRGARKIVHVTFFLLNVSVAAFNAVFLLATTSSNESFAHFIWYFNAIDIGVALFYTHWIFGVTGKAEAHKRFIAGSYVVGGLLLGAIILFPQHFIPSVEPKLYLNFYANAGILYDLMAVYFFALPLIAWIHLVREHNAAESDTRRNRLRYVILGSAFGYATGSTAFPLIWNIPLDPFFSLFVGWYNLIFAYAIYKHRLMNIKTVIQKALLYAVLVGIVSWTLFLVGALNNYLVQNVAAFQERWVIPLIAGLIAVIIGRFFWRKLRATEERKREFITVAAHNLRTPLTRIKFAILTLIEHLDAKQDEQKEPSSLSVEDKRLLHEISQENGRLIELTNILLEVAEDNSRSEDLRERIAIRDILNPLLTSYKNRGKRERVMFNTDEMTHDPIYIEANPKRITTVLQVLLDNAFAYTSEGGTVRVATYREEGLAIIAVTDTGIGIAKEDLSQIFSKFYRAEQALRTDTEGVGLGLFIAKKIIEEHDGELTATSPGEGKGSTFYVKLPLAK